MMFLEERSIAIKISRGSSKADSSVDGKSVSGKSIVLRRINSIDDDKKTMHLSDLQQQHHQHSWLNSHQAEKLISLEGGINGLPVDCCPSALEMIEPEGGINQHNMHVRLFRDGSIKQRFYEVSCRNDVLNQPCRFMQKRFHNRSRCVQKYSYTYAVILNIGSRYNSNDNLNNDTNDTSNINKNSNNNYSSDSANDFDTSQQPPLFSTSPFYSLSDNLHQQNGWMLDYIKIRSGCSCEITPNPKKKGLKNNR